MVKREPTNPPGFVPFEGLWLTTTPSASVAYAKIINHSLSIPYSSGDEPKLLGHYFDCSVIDQTLFARFEQFDSAKTGAIFLRPGPNGTLKGGRWMMDQLPKDVQNDISQVSEDTPGMKKIVWIRILKTPTPEWAEKYFREEWPNKPISNL